MSIHPKELGQLFDSWAYCFVNMHKMERKRQTHKLVERHFKQWLETRKVASLFQQCLVISSCHRWLQHCFRETVVQRSHDLNWFWSCTQATLCRVVNRHIGFAYTAESSKYFMFLRAGLCVWSPQQSSYRWWVQNLFNTGLGRWFHSRATERAEKNPLWSSNICFVAVENSSDQWCFRWLKEVAVCRKAS